MTISRRNALLGATAAAVVAGVPGAVQGTIQDPVIDLVRDLHAARKAWCSADDTFGEACHRAGVNMIKGRRELDIEPLWQEVERWKARCRDLGARVVDTPATTTRGVLAKLRGYFYDDEIAQIMAGDGLDDGLPPEFAASVYRDLERLAGEARS